MTNSTYFHDFLEKKALMIGLYLDLAEFWMLPPVVVKLLQIVAFVVVGWIACLSFLTLTGPILPATRKPNKDIFFVAFTEKIRKKFPHQSNETIQTIFMGTNRVMRTNEEDPTVFLMLVPNGAMPTAFRLVALLIHCILLANQLPASEEVVNRAILDGSTFTSPDNEWPLFHQVRRQLRYYGVAAVMSFECLHPQIVRTLQLLAPQVHAPHPESVLILVMDLNNRLTEYQRNNVAPNILGRTFLEEYFGPYFNRIELVELIKRFSYRCVVVNAEPQQ